MELYLLRHGHAVSDGTKDHLRPLSELGEQEIRFTASRFSRELSKVESVFVSPFLRAQQSADLVRDHLNPDVNFYESEFIVPSGDAASTIDMLYEFHAKNSCQSALLVCHNPFIETLAALLCHVELGACRFATASLAALDVDVYARGCASLRWLHHAK